MVGENPGNEVARYTTRYLLNKAVVVGDDDLCSSIKPKVVALCRFAPS